MLERIHRLKSAMNPISKAWQHLSYQCQEELEIDLRLLENQDDDAISIHHLLNIVEFTKYRKSRVMKQKNVPNVFRSNKILKLKNRPLIFAP